MIRQDRAQPQRQALGRRIRSHRLALGLSARDVAEHLKTGRSQMTAIESTTADVTTGVLIDAAEAVGLVVALAAEHHLPLLDLTAAEVDAVREVLYREVDAHGAHRAPLVASALAKLQGRPSHAPRPIRRTTGQVVAAPGQVWQSRDPRRPFFRRVLDVTESHGFAIVARCDEHGRLTDQARRRRVRVHGGQLSRHDYIGEATA